MGSGNITVAITDENGGVLGDVLVNFNTTTESGTFGTAEFDYEKGKAGPTFIHVYCVACGDSRIQYKVAIK